MRRLVWILSIVVLMLVSSGCGKRDADVASPTPPPSEDDLIQQAVDTLRGELQQLFDSGETNAVLERIVQAMNDPTLERADSMIFSWYVGELVRQQRTNEARTVYLEAAIDDAERAQAAYAAATSMYDRGPPEGLYEWVNTLAELPVVPQLRARTWSALMRCLLKMDRAEEAVQRVPAMLEAVPDGNARVQLVREIVRNATRSKQYETARAILKALGSQDGLSEPMQALVKTSEVDILMAEERMPEAEAALWKHTPSLTDRQVSSRFRRLMQSYIRTGNDEAASGLVRRAIADLGDKTKARDGVVSLWVEAAGKSNDPRAFVERTSQALDAAIALPSLLNAFEEGFYSIMSAGPDDLKQRCMALMNRMREAPCDDEQTMARLILLRLDSAFYRNDFREAQTIIGEGIPGRDQEWHDILLNKVSAHLALQENRPDDAIAHFREHMQTVSEWEHPERDPETGIMMIKEAVLGFNEKRIGDIYASIGEAEKAKAAYATARDWYTKALAEVEADSEEHKAYEKEMAAVPKP